MKKGLVIALIIITLIGLFVYYIAGTVRMMNVAGKKDSITTVSAPLLVLSPTSDAFWGCEAFIGLLFFMKLFISG